MKKFKLVFLAMLTIAMGACSNEEPMLQNSNNNAGQSSATTPVLRTPEDAIGIANQVANLMSGKVSWRFLL